MSPKKGAEPLKLLPLKQFGKLVEEIAHVPKDAVTPRGSKTAGESKREERKNKTD